MIKLSLRLKDILRHLDFSETIIDIGCDHCQLGIYLIQNNKFNHFYASDNKLGALNNAINNINKYRLNNKITLLLGDGLEAINDKSINTLIISGMGTNNILKILKNDKIKQINKIIIQSNNKHYLLRKELAKIGFKDIKETVVVDHNLYYITISFVRGESILSNIELKYGIHYNKIYLKLLLKNINIILKKLDKKSDKYKSTLKEASVLKEFINNL